MKVKELKFKEWYYTEETKNRLIGCKFKDGGYITILDRQTGFGNGMRDIETGYHDSKDHFWLASGMFDIRDYEELTVEDAITLIKTRSNTCRGE